MTDTELIDAIVAHRFDIDFDMGAPSGPRVHVTYRIKGGYREEAVEQLKADAGAALRNAIAAACRRAAPPEGKE